MRQPVKHRTSAVPCSDEPGHSAPDAHDAKIAELAQKGLSTVDPAERKAIYRQLFDRVNEMSYVIPIASFPDVVMHGKDLAIDKDPVHATGFEFVDMGWK